MTNTLRTFTGLIDWHYIAPCTALGIISAAVATRHPEAWGVIIIFCGLSFLGIAYGDWIDTHERS